MQLQTSKQFVCVLPNLYFCRIGLPFVTLENIAKEAQAVDYREGKTGQRASAHVSSAVPEGLIVIRARSDAGARVVFKGKVRPAAGKHTNADCDVHTAIVTDGRVLAFSSDNQKGLRSMEETKMR